MTSLNKATSYSAIRLASVRASACAVLIPRRSVGRAAPLFKPNLPRPRYLLQGFRSGGMPSASSVPSRWRATVLLNRRMANTRSGVPRFQPTAGVPAALPASSPPTAAIRTASGPESAAWVTSLPGESWWAILLTVIYWSFIAQCLDRGGYMYVDAGVAFMFWATAMIGLSLRQGDMTSLNKATSYSAIRLASGFRSGGMPSASSVPSRWRATVLLNQRTASGHGGAPCFQPATGPRGSSPRRRRGFPPPAAAPRNLTSLLEAPKRAKQWVTSLDGNKKLAILVTVHFWSVIALCLYTADDDMYKYADAFVVFAIWAMATFALCSGFRSGGMPSASSVPSRWRATVLLNQRTASGHGGAPCFRPATGPRGSSPRRRRGFPPPAAAPRNLTSLLEAPKRAKQWVTSLDGNKKLAILVTVHFWSVIALCLYTADDDMYKYADAFVVFAIWAMATFALCSGFRSGGMPSASSVPSRWRATVLLNQRTASGHGGAPCFRPATGPRGSSPRRRRGFPPPAAAPRNLTSLLEAPKRAKQWVTSLDGNKKLAILVTVHFWSVIALCLYTADDDMYKYADAFVVFAIWAMATFALCSVPRE
ncbi:hypothetical protein ACK3TF_000722 [Chlorella vulgaris]